MNSYENIGRLRAGISYLTHLANFGPSSTSGEAAVSHGGSLSSHYPGHTKFALVTYTCKYDLIAVKTMKFKHQSGIGLKG